MKIQYILQILIILFGTVILILQVLFQLGVLMRRIHQKVFMHNGQQERKLFIKQRFQSQIIPFNFVLRVILLMRVLLLLVRSENSSESIYAQWATGAEAVYKAEISESNYSVQLCVEGDSIDEGFAIIGQIGEFIRKYLCTMGNRSGSCL